MEHKLKVRNGSTIITSQEKKKVPDVYHKFSYYNKGKAGEQKKGKKMIFGMQEKYFCKYSHYDI